MLVDENAYNEYTNSTKYIGVDFLTKDVENAIFYEFLKDLVKDIEEYHKMRNT